MKLFLAKLGARFIELVWVLGFIYCEFLEWFWKKYESICKDK